jgi:uncharacterized protein YjbI with pentapeptide repeats
VRLGDLDDGSDALLGVDAHGDGERFRSADLSGRNLAGATFTDCELTDVNLNDTQLRGVRIADCVLDRVDAPVLRASRSSWRAVEIGHSRIGSGELYDSGLESVRFSNCKLGYLNLRGSSLRDVLFEDCTIDELDLGGAKATRVAITDTTVGMLDVTQAQLHHLDLRGADLRGIHGVEGLRGSTLDPLQVAELASFFAAELGITVEEGRA